MSVITASEPSWIAPFTGLTPRYFGKLLTTLRSDGADAVHRGRPWSLSLEDRVLLVTAYWRTNLTMRQIAQLFGVSKSTASRVINHLGPLLAFRPRKRFATDTLLIVDGTLMAGSRGDHPELTPPLLDLASELLDEPTEVIDRRVGLPAA